MKKKLQINPAYAYLKEFVESIPETFENTGKEIHTGRNKIKVLDIKGQKFVIKYFERISWINRLVYATIRKSKAQRAYEYAKYLLKNKISNPEPVAYLNVYKNCILTQSFYLSRYTPDKSIQDIIDLPLAQSEEILKALARFSFQLHQLGIYHNDYNPTNILYKKNGQDYTFSLIDFNRMNFSKPSKKRNIQNLSRLHFKADKMGVFVTEYARLANYDTLSTLHGIIASRLRFKSRKRVTDSLKKFAKRLIKSSR